MSIVLPVISNAANAAITEVTNNAELKVLQLGPSVGGVGAPDYSTLDVTSETELKDALNRGETLITISGDITITRSLTINSDITLDSRGNGRLLINSGVTLTCNGIISNIRVIINDGGTVTNSGTIRGKISNDGGTVTNSGIMNSISNDGGTVTITKSGSVSGYVSNDGRGTIVNSGTMSCIITNNGKSEIINQKDGIIRIVDGINQMYGEPSVNYEGTITNYGTINNEAKFTNYGVIKDGGTINNSGSGRIDNVDGGKITGVTNIGGGSFSFVWLAGVAGVVLVVVGVVVFLLLRKRKIV